MLKFKVHIHILVLTFFALLSYSNTHAQIKRKKKQVTYNKKKYNKQLKGVAKDQKHHEKEKEKYQKEIEEKELARKKAEEELLKAEERAEERELKLAEKNLKKESKKGEKKEGEEVDSVQTETEIKIKVIKPSSYWSNPDSRFYYNLEGQRTLDSTEAAYYIIRTDKYPSLNHKRTQRSLEFIEDTDGQIAGFYITGEKYFDGYSNLGDIDYRLSLIHI